MHVFFCVSKNVSVSCAYTQGKREQFSGFNRTLDAINNVFRKFSAFHDETGRLNVDGMNIRSEERFSRNAETDLVCRLLLEKKKYVRPGEVLTNMQVIKGAHRVEIHTLEGKGRTYPVAGALAVGDEADMALLKVDMPAHTWR